MAHAYDLGKQSQDLHFDWDNAREVEEKVEEEWGELKAALKKWPGFKASTYEELGDILFTLVQLARHLDIDPEKVLTLANDKFSKRFSLMKRMIEEEGLDILVLSRAQKEIYWEKANKILREGDGG